MKLTGKPNVGNPHFGFDEAGAGNGLLRTTPALVSTYEGLGVKFPRATQLFNFTGCRKISGFEEEIIKLVILPNYANQAIAFKLTDHNFWYRVFA
jgi:hypothetical protein